MEFVVRATKKLLRRLGPAALGADEAPTTLLDRFPDELATVLTAQGVPAAIVTAELNEMRQHRPAPTARQPWCRNGPGPP